MSQKGSKQPRRRDTAVTKKALQEQWKRLELKPATMLHLQELLDTAGLMEAALVTDVLAREKRPPIATVSKEWGFTELRLISLEGVRPHLMEGLRCSLETLMAWHLIRLPEGSLEHVAQIILAVLCLVMSIVGVCLTCRLRSHVQAKFQRTS